MPLRKLLCLALIGAFIAMGGPRIIIADDHDQEHDKSLSHEVSYESHSKDGNRKHRHRQRGGWRGDDDDRYMKPVSNQEYKESCGACHFAYQPDLLPSASWKNILDHLNDHFGESVELAPDTQKTIAAYLETNAAEHSSATRAVRIVRCLGGTIPARITEIPYIRRKHHEISAEVFKRKSIGSFSNCSACHTKAEEGIYEDDSVVIPK